VGQCNVSLYYLGNCLKELRKAQQISPDSRPLGKDLNPRPPEYEVGVLTTQQRPSYDGKRGTNYRDGMYQALARKNGETS
jgi:hypothetical protein